MHPVAHRGNLLSLVPVVVAGCPIHAGPREAAVPDRLPFLSERKAGVNGLDALGEALIRQISWRVGWTQESWKK